MSGPDKMYASYSTRGQCVVSFAASTPSEEYCIPYTRTDLIPDPHAVARAALEKAAEIADEYHRRALEWAKTVRGLEQHIGETDSSRIAAAIRALMEPAALAEIVKGTTNDH
jgi:hypothetical protein